MAVPYVFRIPDYERVYGFKATIHKKLVYQYQYTYKYKH